MVLNLGLISLTGISIAILNRKKMYQKMLWTKDELELKIKENKITSNDLDEIVKDCQDAEKYRQLKEKMKQIEEESYLFDRLEACDTSGAAEVLRSFLSSRESE